jgi:hypothetical protein
VCWQRRPIKDPPLTKEDIYDEIRKNGGRFHLFKTDQSPFAQLKEINKLRESGVVRMASRLPQVTPAALTRVCMRMTSSLLCVHVCASIK